MNVLEAVLVAIAPDLARLLISAVTEPYDPEAELQALLGIQRRLADERLRRALERTRS